MGTLIIEAQCHGLFLQIQTGNTDFFKVPIQSYNACFERLLLCLF